MTLSPRQQQFVVEYLVDLNAKQAAIRAGYSKKTAEQQGPRLLGYAEVAMAIEKGKAARVKRVEITQDMVLFRLWQIANADVRKLVEHHRTCCRHCWGEDYGYQRTEAEIEKDREDHEEMLARRKRRIARRKAKGIQLDDDETEEDVREPFNEKGGAGYDARKPPNANCTNCWGHGLSSTIINDTRNLDPDAVALYAGVKTGQHGIEVKINDPAAALDRVARHLGMFKDKLELTGADGTPIQVVTGVPASPEKETKK